MDAGSYWDTGPSDPGRATLKFTKVKNKLVPVMPASPIPCTLCKKPFYHYVHLQQHSRCHSGSRPFRCHKCNRSFLQLAHLQSHQLLKHETRKKCRSCAAVFPRWSKLLHHIIQTHGSRVALCLPKLKAQKCAKPEKLQKLSIKLCIKKSIMNMTEDSNNASWTVKKRKKHKKHKKEARKSKSSKRSKSPESKPRIILKFKMPKDCSSSRGDLSQSVNGNEQSPSEQKTQSTTTANKTEAFTELVQSPSPKDSGIDDCSPLHETDHNENCSSNSSGGKSGEGNKPPKTCSPNSSSLTPASSLPSSNTTLSPRRPTRQDAALRSLMSPAKENGSSSVDLDACTPDSKDRQLRRARSSQNIKQEEASPSDSSSSSDVQPSKCDTAHSPIEQDYLVPQSPSVPSLKITISKMPAGKLRGSRTSYTSSLHVSSDFIPPPSPSGSSIVSKSPRSSPASPRLSKRHQSPFRCGPSSMYDPTDSPKQLVYSANCSTPATPTSRSPRLEKKGRRISPKLCRMESSDTVYSSSQQSLSSPPHSLKSERDYGPLSVDIDEDPYAFDDDPCNNSPHLLPYTSTLPRRSDKYKLDPPVLEPQIMPSLTAQVDMKHTTRPRLTKQIDIRKRRPRKSPVRSSATTKDCKSPKMARERKRSRTDNTLIASVKNDPQVENGQTLLQDEIMPVLKQSVPVDIENRTLNLNPVQDITMCSRVESDKTNKSKNCESEIASKDCQSDTSENTNLETNDRCVLNKKEPSISPQQGPPSNTQVNGVEASSLDTSMSHLLTDNCTLPLPSLFDRGEHAKEITTLTEKDLEAVLGVAQSESNHIIESTAMDVTFNKVQVENERNQPGSKSDGHSVTYRVDINVEPMESECSGSAGACSEQVAIKQVFHLDQVSSPESLAVVVSDVLSETLTPGTEPATLTPAQSGEASIHTQESVPEQLAEVVSTEVPNIDVAAVAMEDVVNSALDDSDLLLSDPHLENLSFNDSFLDLGDDDVEVNSGRETLFDDFVSNAAELHSADTASKASSSEFSKKKIDSDPIVVTLPGEAGMEPMSLVIDNDDSDHFGVSDDDFDLASSLSSAALPSMEGGGAMSDMSLSVSRSSSLIPATPSSQDPPRQPPLCPAAVIDTDSEFADLQAACSPLEQASKPSQDDVHHATGFFNAFANFVGAKSQTKSSATLTQGYSSEFAKFLSQKSVLSDETSSGKSEVGSVVSDVVDSKTWTKAEVMALKHSHQQVQKLCEQVWRLLRELFPYLELPVYMSGSSPCGVEALMEQVAAVINSEEDDDDEMMANMSNHAIPGPRTCCEPSVSLCSQPAHCLSHLRTKVCNLLSAILPQLSLPPSFNRTGEDVDTLLLHVIESNVT